MTTMNSAAESAREAARQGNGKFGHQAHAEADLDLGAGAAADLDPSHPDSPLNRANDDAFAALQARMLAVAAHREKLTTRHVARTIQEKYPSAAYLSFQRKNGDEGPYVAAKNVYDAEGTVLDSWAYGIPTASGTSVAEYMDRCDLNMMNPAAGFTYDEAHQQHHEDYVGALDLNEAAELDVTAPAELTDPKLRPLNVADQSRLVELADSYIDDRWNYLKSSDGAADYSDEDDLVEAMADNASDVALVSDLAPGESHQGKGAQVALSRVWNSHEEIVVELGDADDVPSGRVVAGTSLELGTPLDELDIESIEENFRLGDQFAHLRLDTLDDETLAISGITRQGRTLRITDRSQYAQNFRARRAAQS